MNLTQFMTDNFWIVIIIMLWTLPWKGYALWKSAKQSQMWWFVAMFLINSLAILEIIYLFFVLPYLDKKNAGRVA